MDFNNQFRLFKRQSLKGSASAKNKLLSQSSLIFQPYYDSNAQRNAIQYPFLHAAQCVANILSISYGLYLICKGIVTAQSPLTIGALLPLTILQVGTLLVNAFNLLLALCSLISRSIATLSKGRYVFESDLIPLEIGEEPDTGSIAVNARELAIELARQKMTQAQTEAEHKENENLELAFMFI